MGFWGFLCFVFVFVCFVFVFPLKLLKEKEGRALRGLSIQWQRPGRLSAPAEGLHVRAWASFLFSTFFFLNFSFSPHPAEVEAEGGW